ncbi:hypothetical protein [Dysgonomonas sp. Marseille-P4361]|uniref:hypothetical protein n=1 Tax=Dysgonomonas sp. Marseille-P4361 TaxID=2161820 RepID=UPI000D556299|nr:hypothetical protein [Dysgonomonas sp. Marseille-P4361]
MKQLVKNLTLYLSFTIALTACNSENEDDYQDNILSGTEWVSTDLKPSDNVTEENFHMSFNDILRAFPLVSYNVDNNPIIKNIEITKKGDITYYDEILKFENSNCAYNNLVYSISSIKEVENEFKRYIIPNQECISPRGDYTLSVKNNGIFYHPTERPLESKLIIELKNNNLDEYVKTIKVISERSDTVFQNKEVEIMYFKRNENEIVMYNNDVKFIGNLDKDNWLIKLSRISPSLKELGNFKLKTKK